jgi:phage shock protein A
MNKARRKDINKLIEKLQSLQGDLEVLMEELENIKTEEEDYLDNIPENLQSSERYEKAENAVDNLETAYGELEEMRDRIDDVVSYLEEAAE